jgi:antitoxin component of MazEF toxin-antitoxin module
MITSIQKIVGIGSSDGVTLPAKELKRANIKRGDEVEITVRLVRARRVVKNDDQAVIDAAKKILRDYRQDFQNLSQR